MQLVRSGVREDFLVRALRDELTTNCQMLANTEAGTRNAKSSGRVSNAERWTRNHRRVSREVGRQRSRSRAAQRRRGGRSVAEHGVDDGADVKGG